MLARDTVWVQIAGRIRPAIVLEVQPDLIRIAYGTSEHHAWPKVIVHAETRQGRAFPLRETTHFYGANTGWERPADLRAGRAPCAWELLFEIRKIVDEYDASVSPD